MADRLADVSPFASVPFERLLADVVRLGAARQFDHGPQRPGIRSGSSRPSAGSARRATLRCWPRSDQGPPSGTLMRARWACRVPGTGSDPDWQTADAKTSTRRQAGILRVPVGLAGGGLVITLVYVTAEHLAGGGSPPLSLFAFAGAALIGLGFARARVPTVDRPIGRCSPRSSWPWPSSAGCCRWGLRRLRSSTNRPSVSACTPQGSFSARGPRGSAHTTAPDDERTAETALGPGLAGYRRPLGVPDGHRRHGEPAVVGTATSATVIFVTAGLASIGLARLGSSELGSPGRRPAHVVGVCSESWRACSPSRCPSATILGVPLADAIRGGAGVIGRAHRGRRHGSSSCRPPCREIRPAWSIEFLRGSVGVGIGTAVGDIGGDPLPTSRACSGPSDGTARLSAWWRSSSRSSWPSWWCERSSNGRVDPRSTATSSSSAKARARSGRLHRPRLPLPGATPPRATRARPTWRASRSWHDGPESCAVPPRPPASMPQRPRRPSGPPMGASPPTTHSSNSETDSAAVRASSSDRALATPSGDGRLASGQHRAREASPLTARAGQLSAQ